MPYFTDASYDPLIDDASIKHSELSQQIFDLAEDIHEADPHEIVTLRLDHHVLSIKSEAAQLEVEILTLQARISYFEHIGRQGCTLSRSKELLEHQKDLLEHQYHHFDSA